MTCDDCGQPATVHTLDVVGGVKQEIHLCRKCADKRKLIPAEKTPNLPAVVQKVATSVSVLPVDLAKLQCPDCGLSYMEFRKQGRLGCPNDYLVFRDGLIPLLDRIHRGTHHTGKQPTHSCRVEKPDERYRLRCQLRKAVREEDFEQAATIRDLIRERESQP